jgi:hypothetical protein
MRRIAPTTGGPLPVANYFCSCGRVQYFQKSEGHFAASHFLHDGEWKPFTFGLHRYHEHIHKQQEYRDASAEEKCARHEQRSRWLFENFERLIDDADRNTPRCPNCFPAMPRHHWPHFYTCQRCGDVVVDSNSHFTGAGEFIYRRNLEGTTTDSKERGDGGIIGEE